MFTSSVGGRLRTGAGNRVARNDIHRVGLSGGQCRRTGVRDCHRERVGRQRLVGRRGPGDQPGRGVDRGARGCPRTQAVGQRQGRQVWVGGIATDAVTQSLPDEDQLGISRRREEYGRSDCAGRADLHCDGPRRGQWRRGVVRRDERDRNRADRLSRPRSEGQYAGRRIDARAVRRTRAQAKGQRQGRRVVSRKRSWPDRP